MPNVQIREVPDDVHAALVRKAELAGQSLQQYLSAQLARLAVTPTTEARKGACHDPAPSQRCRTNVLVVDASVIAPAIADGGPDGDLCRAAIHGQRSSPPTPSFANAPGPRCQFHVI
jgi:hypothetical protein